MANKVIPPVYSQIALDIAIRIMRGELKENTMIYGRSIMSSEYGVSPETIRRAMKLLADMKIVEILKNSGTMILSSEKAKKYVEKFGKQTNIRSMQKKLDELMEQQKSINMQIVATNNALIRMNEKLVESNPFSNYEIMVPRNSIIVNYTLAELNFWQETRATLIAIKREENIILSPGPYVLIQADDVIVFIGDVGCVETVSEFVNRLK